MTKIGPKTNGLKIEAENAKDGKSKREREKNEINIEAKSQNIGGNKGNILGVTVSSASNDQVLALIRHICDKKDYDRPFFVVTVYSEFFLQALDDKTFAAALNKADLRLPDGVSVPAAADFLSRATGRMWPDMWTGLKVGVSILRGKYAKQTIAGVKLVRRILEEGAKKHRKVFLLGGYGQVGLKLAAKLGKESPKLELAVDSGPQNLSLQQTESEYRITPELEEKIKKFSPDIILVALGRYKQEKWIAVNLTRLTAKVVIGVGSSFDEILGEGKWGKKTPDAVERMGLKWLWRVIQDPGHLRRAWRAFPVFAWKVYRSGLRD